MTTLFDARAVASRLNRSRSWFYEHRKALELRGFPRPIPVVERWDPQAVDDWLVRQRKMDAAARAHVEDAGIDGLFGL